MNEQLEIDFRTRNETKFRKTSSKDGTFCPTLSATIAKRLSAYCSRKNINKTKFVEQCVSDCLDRLEHEFYESLSKDELIRLLTQK